MLPPADNKAFLHTFEGNFTAVEGYYKLGSHEKHVEIHDISNRKGTLEVESKRINKHRLVIFYSKCFFINMSSKSIFLKFMLLIVSGKTNVS